MSDLISRSALLEKIDVLYMTALRKNGVSVEDIYQLDHMAMLVKDAPAVDAEPVRYGEWDEDTVPFCNVCPECGAVVERHCVKHNGSLKRCPNCGCKMDAEVEG